MIINGYTVEGDPDGLAYLEQHSNAFPALMDLIRREGTSSFMVGNRRFIIMPGTGNTFVVSESHGHSRHGRTTNPLNKYI